jgi:large subunit ribosomal protein L9
MKVILQQNVQKLGKAGDVVEASPGYFRNFLQPRKFAVLATGGTLKKREEDLETIKKKSDAAHQASVDIGDKITAVGKIHLHMKAGEGGKLYGKVTTKEIAQALQKELGFEIDKRSIKTAEDISALGTYKILIKVAPEVQSEVLVEVLLEGAVPSSKQPVVAAVEDENAEGNAEEEAAAEELAEV